MRGVVRVLGGPGTGKSSLLIETAAAHIAAGADPESVLLLTGSARLRHAGRAPRSRRPLLAAGSRAVVREPLVRTVHSYAFAVLRLAAQRNGDPPPRLITSAEQDGIIRELLAGDLEDGDRVRRGLAAPAAARAEHRRVRHRTARPVGALHRTRRGSRCAATHRAAVGPSRVAGRGPVRAGSTSRSCCCAPRSGWPRRRPPCLHWAPPNSSAPRWRRSRPTPTCWPPNARRIKLLLVDDAQHLDPQAARLVRVLPAGAELTVIAGDPNQSVFGLPRSRSGAVARRRRRRSR